MHGNADRLADPHPHDARRRVPAVVLAGVAGQHALVLLHHVVQDRLGNGDLLLGADALAGAADLGGQLLGVRVQEHHAAAVGLDPLEDQIHDPLQELVDVQRVAHGQGRAVHHLEVAPARASQEVCGGLGVALQDTAALLVRQRADDPRLVPGELRQGDVDLCGEVFAGVLGGAGEEHQRAADLHLVAAGQRGTLHPLAVDEGPVGAVQVGEVEDAVLDADIRVLAGDFGIVELDDIGDVPAQADRRTLQLEAGPLIVAADHEQRRHGSHSENRAFRHPGTKVPPSGAAGQGSLGRIQQFFDSTDQRPIVVGLGHDFCRFQGRLAWTNAPQNHQGRLPLGRFTGEGLAKHLGGGFVDLQVQHDQIRLVFPASSKPRWAWLAAKIRQPRRSNAVVSTCAGLFRTVNDQHATIGDQVVTLRGLLPADFLVHLAPIGPSGWGARIAFLALRVKANCCSPNSDFSPHRENYRPRAGQRSMGIPARVVQKTRARMPMLRRLCFSIT